MAPAETYAVAERLMTVVRPNMRAEISNTRVFQEFVKLNERVETYVGHLLKLYERRGTPIKGCLVGDTKKILADQDTRGAGL